MNKELLEALDSLEKEKVDVYGSVIGIRSVIMQYQIICSADLRICDDGFFDLSCQLSICALPENFGQCVPKHFNSGFDDDK